MMPNNPIERIGMMIEAMSRAESATRSPYAITL
jgi:hypothetical protein